MNSTVFLNNLCEMLPSTTSVLSVGKLTFKEVFIPLVSVFAGASLAYRSQEVFDKKKTVEAELDALIKLHITLLNQLDQIAGTCSEVSKQSINGNVIAIAPIKLMSKYDFDSSKLSFLFVKNTKLYSKVDLRIKRYEYAVTQIGIFNQARAERNTTKNIAIAYGGVMGAAVDIITEHSVILEELQDFIKDEYSLKFIKNITSAQDLGESLRKVTAALDLINGYLKQYNNKP